MNINLLAESVILVLSVFLTSLVTYLMVQRGKERSQRKLGLIAFAAILTSLFVEYGLHFIFYADKLPWNLWLMFFPFIFTLYVALLIWVEKINRLKWLALAGILPGLLFSLALINNYYRFYPSLYSVFNIETRQQAYLDQNATYLQFGNTSHEQYDQSTIEASLYGNSIQDTSGTIQSITIPGIISKFKARKEYVYIPKIAESSGRVNLPVIILLPGTPGLTQNTLDGLEVKNTMDYFAKSHHGITPYVFMLDDTGTLTNDTECVDSPRGNVETYLTQDVPTYIKANFEVASSPSNWAIGGLSMGGMCGAMLALRHQDVYHYFLDFGGEGGPEVGPNNKTVSALFHGSQAALLNHQVPNLLNGHQYSNMGGYFVSAQSDNASLVKSIHNNYLQARSSGLDAVYENIKGEHTFNVWAQGYKDAIPWLSNRLGATVCSVSCK